MPIQKCSKDGKDGYSWGNGNCIIRDTPEEAKKVVIRQGLAIEGPDKFKKIMQHGKTAAQYFGDKEGVAIAKAALSEYERESYTSKFVKSIARVVKADDGQNNTGVNMGGMLDDPEDKGCADTYVDNAGPDSNSDTRGNDDGNEFNKPGQSAKADPQDNNDAYLDKDRKQPAGNIVIPPYNDDASPDTDPAKTPSDGVYQEPPTRDDMNGKAGSITEIPEKEDIVKKTVVGESNDENMAVADINAVANYLGYTTAELEYILANKCYGYISQKERDAMPEADFAGKNRSFPISNQAHLDAAVKLLGRKSPSEQAEIKKRIVEIAHRKNLKLPDSWTGNK